MQHGLRSNIVRPMEVCMPPTCHKHSPKASQTVTKAPHLDEPPHSRMGGERDWHTARLLKTDAHART